MKLRYKLLCLLGLSLTASTAIATPVVTETEDNNTFATRQLLTDGTIQVNGTLELFDTTDFDYQFSGDLDPFQDDTFDITGLTAGDSFIAWTNNTLGLGGQNPDTLLGSFDPSSNLIDFDDNSSLVGDGRASALGGTVNADGSVRLGVTGAGDTSFVGTHLEGLTDGFYDVFVRLGTSSFGDIDFLTFSGLDPGSQFMAELFVGNAVGEFVLGWLDDSGALTETGSKNSLNTTLTILGTVPTSGELHLGVTGFGDAGFTGNHLAFGDYTLSLSGLTAASSAGPAPPPEAVPEPGSFILLGIGCLFMVGLRWRCRRGRCSDRG